MVVVLLLLLFMFWFCLHNYGNNFETMENHNLTINYLLVNPFFFTG